MAQEITKKEQRFYVHVSYRGTINNGSLKVGGSKLMSFTRLSLDELSLIARRNLEEGCGQKLDSLPVITSISELSKELYEVLLGDSKEEKINLDEIQLKEAVNQELGKDGLILHF